MDPVRWHAPGGQAGTQVAEEARWPANVEAALSIIRSRPAVPDLTSPASKHLKKLSHLRAERMGLAIACTVQPPDLPKRSARRQGMQHREHRCRADSGAQEHHRSVARPQREAASRFADIEDVAQIGR